MAAEFFDMLLTGKWDLCPMSSVLGSVTIWPINYGINNIVSVSRPKLLKKVSASTIRLLGHLLLESRCCALRKACNPWRVQCGQELEASMPQPQPSSWLTPSRHLQILWLAHLEIGPPVSLSQLMQCEARDNCLVRALSKSLLWVK